MADTSRKYGLLAEFDTPAEIMRAAARVRDAGYRRWDVYTPYPVHGMDQAMGLKNSPVGWFTFICGTSGFTLGMLMIWFMNAYDYSLVVGGKPLFSPIYAFPVSYECTILLGAFGSLFGMLILNRLPRLYHPLFKSNRFRQVTHDKFFIAIESADPKFDDAETRKLLEEAGGKHIEEVRD
jgi:Alternative complex III, ActD subunit